ncbi:hypothetical protein C8Q77DRAFT_273083 [Trametes polyzona]|nr:hypothetical protein C8Q77DRAFT_273083 [Trametes polyzona]
MRIAPRAETQKCRAPSHPCSPSSARGRLPENVYVLLPLPELPLFPRRFHLTPPPRPARRSRKAQAPSRRGAERRIRCAYIIARLCGRPGTLNAHKRLAEYVTTDATSRTSASPAWHHPCTRSLTENKVAPALPLSPLFALSAPIPANILRDWVANDESGSRPPVRSLSYAGPVCESARLTAGLSANLILHEPRSLGYPDTMMQSGHPRDQISDLLEVGHCA